MIDDCLCNTCDKFKWHDGPHSWEDPNWPTDSKTTPSPTSTPKAVAREDGWISSSQKPPTPHKEGKWSWSDELLIWDGTDQHFATYWTHRGFVDNHNQDCVIAIYWRLAPVPPKEKEGK